MTSHVAVPKKVDLTKYIFDYILHLNTGCGKACTFELIQEFLENRNIKHSEPELSSAINELIVKGYIRLEITGHTAPHSYYSFPNYYQTLSFSLTGRTTEPLQKGLAE